MRIASSSVLPVLLCCGVTNCFRDGRYQLANSNNTSHTLFMVVRVRLAKKQPKNTITAIGIVA